MYHYNANNLIKQVCVQLPTSADNTTLLAFAADRHVAVAPLLLGGRRCRLYAGHTADTRRAAAAVDRWTDIQSDGRRPYRYIDPAAYYASCVNNITYLHLDTSGGIRCRP